MNRHERRRAARIAADDFDRPSIDDGRETFSTFYDPARSPKKGAIFQLFPPANTSQVKLNQVAEDFFPVASDYKTHGWPGINIDLNDKSIHWKVKVGHWLSACDEWLGKNVGPGWHWLPVNRETGKPYGWYEGVLAGVIDGAPHVN